MKALIGIFLTAILSGCSFSATPSNSGRLVSIEVIGENTCYKVAQKDGNIFFAAPIGQEYSIIVRNLTGKRILAIPTVDGLNVIDRSRGDWSGSGYVLSPYELLTITGFRRRDDWQYVERFTFNKARFSLANRIGDVRNVGVIGVAVFEEYVPEPVYIYKGRMDCGEPMGQTAMAPSRSAQAECERAGTEAGRTVHDPVRRVSFQRATEYPAEIIALYYDTEENLVDAGILRPSYSAPPRGFLSPFPSNYVNGGY